MRLILIAWTKLDVFRTAELRPNLVEEGEVGAFRERFRGERFGALDWQPAAEIRERVPVWLYDAAQR